MSGKVKMRCVRCGKPFKSSSPKQTLCPDCEAKARRERAATKSTPAKPAAVAAPSRAAPKVVGPGAAILVPDLTTATPASAEAVPPDTGLFGSAARAAERMRHEAEHAPTPTRAPAAQTPHVPAPHEPAHEKHSHEKGTASRSTPRQLRDAKPPREPHTPRQPTPRIELTDELREKIQARYLELAQPVEFDGIRTQIAGELSVPKALVKRAVAELRAQMQLPSWWELQAYSGSEEDLTRIREAYLPHLPVPDVGVHKQISSALHLDPAVVYQGIRRIRAELRLPQYNPPETHERERTAQQ